MIENDPSKTIKSITRDMGLSEFSYHAASAWRHSLFLIQDEKELIFITDIERTKERLHKKILNKLKHPLQPNYLFFLK